MDSQVVASSSKLNLRRDLRWVAKWTGKFPLKYTQVENLRWPLTPPTEFFKLCQKLCLIMLTKF